MKKFTTTQIAVYGTVMCMFTHLGCHDEAGGTRVDGNITSHQSDILKLFIHLTILLVAKGL